MKHDGINLFEIIDSSTGTLLQLAKETVIKIDMRNLECIGFFVQMFYSPLVGIQRPAASILAELASLRECALVIEQIPGFHEFVQANFCNQFGQLVTAAGSTTAASSLQYVSTMMERLREHRNSIINSNTTNNNTGGSMGFY